MRTIAAALTTLAIAASANASSVTFTKPLLDTPSDLPKLMQPWPEIPAITPPAVDLQEPPQVEGPPEEIQPHLEPFSEEWRCLVPLQGTQPAPDTATRCETPSIEPDDLLHLL